MEGRKADARIASVNHTRATVPTFAKKYNALCKRLSGPVVKVEPLSPEAFEEGLRKAKGTTTR